MATALGMDDRRRAIIDEMDSSTGFVFAGPRGKAIDKIDAAMRAICKSLGCERATPHDLRRTHGTKITEAVSKITWTAAGGGGVKPGEFQEFPISLGPLPEVDLMVFKALQTYSDGTVARWIEEPVDGKPAEQDPAPVLRLAAAPDADGESGSSAPPAASNGG